MKYTDEMSKRIRISNDSLNSYGTRVLTAGMMTEQYSRNPVLLYMHQRGSVIGYVKDLKVEGDEITGELMFDEATDLSKQCKAQYEFGSLKMVSVGIDVLEMSEDKEYLVQGQTRPTVTKSKLFEVSLVDVGANDDAIVMQKDGKRIEFGSHGECALPLLNNKQTNNQFMEQKVLALLLGLAETASESEIRAELDVLKKAKADVATLRQEKDTLALSGITTAVETAIEKKLITAERKEQFITLGKSIGVDELKKTFDAMNPQVKLSGVISHQGGSTATAPATYSKLSEVPSAELTKLREEKPDEYKRLYRAEYGMDCEL